MALDFDKLPQDVMQALGFLTRLPIPATWFEDTSRKPGIAARAYPIAGAIAALPAATILTLATLLDLPVLLTAVVATAALAMTGGGLHEDGLADTADGLFGGKDKQRRLEIMRDSRIGSYGAIALLLAFAIRTVALASILQAGLFSAVLVLIASQAFARTAMVWHWSTLENARLEGLAASVGQPDDDAKLFAFVSGAAITLLACLLARNIAPTLIGLGLAALATVYFSQLCKEKIDGHTGDTLGTSAVLAELALLTGLASGL